MTLHFSSYIKVHIRNLLGGKQQTRKLLQTPSIYLKKMITKAGRHPRFLKTTLNPPSDCTSLLDIPPPNNLELEFIHGCSKKGCNGNIFHMNTSGELVYPAAACGVVYNYENNSQKIFIRHTDDVTCVAKQ